MSVLSIAKKTNVPFKRKGGTYGPQNFFELSTEALANAVSRSKVRTICSSSVYSRSVNSYYNLCLIVALPPIQP